jgi:hypothetical protein
MDYDQFRAKSLALVVTNRHAAATPSLNAPMPISQGIGAQSGRSCADVWCFRFALSAACQHFGAGIVVSEMVASQELVVDNPDSRLRMDVSGLGTSVVQLAGREAVGWARRLGSLKVPAQASSTSIWAARPKSDFGLFRLGVDARS